MNAARETARDAQRPVEPADRQERELRQGTRARDGGKPAAAPGDDAQERGVLDGVEGAGGDLRRGDDPPGGGERVPTRPASQLLAAAAQPMNWSPE